MSVTSPSDVYYDPYDVEIDPVGVVIPCPERVVTSITRLVLPPYSAGGAPEITSSDCTALDGSWLENTLLCWSVMGWPSMEKELEA